MSYSYGGGGGYTNQTYGNNTYGGNQYSTTSYGAQGGNEGGGFMGGSQSSQQAKKAYDKETLRPVTLLQVLEAEETHPGGEIRLDDSEISRICFVGQIRNISKQTINTTFKMDDGTGTVEAKNWSDTDAPTHDDEGNPLPSSRVPLEVGQWAKAYGTIKFLNNRRYIYISMIRAIQDKNEINHHLLEATYMHLYFTRGPPEQFTAGGGAADGASQQQGYQDYGQQAGAVPNIQGGNQRMLQMLSPAARKAYQCLVSTPQTNEGLHIQEIATNARMSVEEAKNASNELLERSLIFTTVDDFTFALLEQS